MSFFKKLKHLTLLFALVLGVCLWHVFWWYGVTPDLQVESQNPTFHSLRFIPTGSGEDAPGAVSSRLLRSPVLFAYPSLAGFSRAVLEEGSGSTPPLASDLELAAPLLRQHEASRRRFIQPESARAQAQRYLDPQEGLLHPELADPLPESYVAAAGWQIELISPAPQLQERPLPSPPTMPEQAFVLQVDLEFDSAGRVQHIFAAPSGEGEAALPPDVLATLHRWRMAPAEDAEGATRRLQLWLSAAAGKTPAGEATEAPDEGGAT